MFFPSHDLHERGRAVLIAPTAANMPAVTLADAKAGLGITDASQDATVTAAIAAAADALDPATGGWLGRALRTQQWELQLRSFGQRAGLAGLPYVNPRTPAQAHQIVLPYPPLVSVDSVKYLDAAGVDQTLVLGAGYRVIGMGQTFGKAAIAPPYGQSWPVPRVDEASIRIRFTCGYDDSAALTAMPRSLKQAIILGARALMSVAAHDMLLLVDRVEGVGEQRFQNTPAVADIVNKAVRSLLINLAIS